MNVPSPTKKKKNGEQTRNCEFIQIKIDIPKPGSKKYAHYDYEELLNKNGKSMDDEDLSRFYDEDTLNMAKKLRETRGKNGKRIRVNLDELQQFNRNSGAGYDKDDDFIDDSEAIDAGNFAYRKGNYYIGRGEVKDLEDDDEEEEESDEEEEVVQKASKPRKKKPKEKKDKPEARNNGGKDAESSPLSSDSEDEPVRLTGAPPTARMTGGPPTKRPQTKRDATPPVVAKDPPPKKKALPVIPEFTTLSSSSSQNSDIVVLDDEPPAKKKKLPEDQPPVLKPEVVKPSNGTSTEPVKSSTKGSAVTMLAKKIVKQQEEMKKDAAVKRDPVTPSKVPEAPSSSSPTKDAFSMKIQEIFDKLKIRGKIFQEKKQKAFDNDTLTEISQFLDLVKVKSKDKSEKYEALTYTLAQAFGMSSKEVIDMTERGMRDSAYTKKDAMDWNLTQADLPFMSEKDIKSMTTMMKVWKSEKEFSNAQLTTWLKEVNQAKYTLDQARCKFFEFINQQPDAEKSMTDVALELPKHERSRKQRMFLQQWVYLSRKYVEKILPKLKKPLSTEGYAKMQVTVVNTMKDQLKKQLTLHANKNEKNGEDTPFVFLFTDPVLASMVPYLEELVDYALSVRKLDIAVVGIDSLHHAVEAHIPRSSFYIEICRRHQKSSFLIVEEPMKTRLKMDKESIAKYQVVQIPKYQIDWKGEEPVMRGIKKEYQDFEKSVLWKPPRLASVPTTPSSSSTSTPGPVPLRTSNTVPSSKPSNPSTSSISKQTVVEEDPKRLQAMNQLVQPDICDASKVPIPDDVLLLIVNVVSNSGVSLSNQMMMLRNVLANVGQARMAQMIAVQKTTSAKIDTDGYKKLFEFFAVLDKSADKTKQKMEKLQEENARKQEEKQKKEKEKQLEKERKEQEKQLEKERKEREKREEKERKERELKEIQERKQKEEEDRILARKRLLEDMEDKRRKKEAEEAVEKELERRAKLEKEEANALQGLEEDLLMDDIDFMTEQQTKVDEQRKIQEAKRAVQRENQIKMMRAQELQRRREETPPTQAPPPQATPPQAPPTQAPPPAVVAPVPKDTPPKPSFSSNSNPVPPPAPPQPVSVKKEVPDPNFDILNAAQEAAGLPTTTTYDPNKNVKLEPGTTSGKSEKVAEKPMSAMEKLASLRGRTMSADMKRGGDNGGSPAHQTPTSSQQFFPSNTMPLQHQDPPQFIPRLQHQNSSQNLQIQQQQPQIQAQPRLQNSSSSGQLYFNNNGSQEEAGGRRTMSMSQHQSSPQTIQQQQFQINSYQSPSSASAAHHNSSLMHTPHSNSSMVSQSPQFSSHPSPMSQQFHTPPSVGMLNHQMVQSPIAQSPLQHFNYPPPQQPQPQMHRQMSQQNLMMAQQQQQQIQQSLVQQQMMQQMSNQMHQNLHFPPNNH